MTNEEAVSVLIEMLGKVENYNMEDRFYQAIAHIAIAVGKMEALAPPTCMPALKRSEGANG